MAKRQNISKKSNLATKEGSGSKLDRIKAAVKQGTYAVDSREVAKSIIKNVKEKNKKSE